jgi:zinc protease
VKVHITSLLLLILTGSILTIKAQSLSDTIPFPSRVISGTLMSGLKYVIQPNKHPAKKVEFRMVVNTGSIVETPEQRGMAHLLEHMAFNGSKNFPGDSIIQALRTLGIKYGFDLNAYTGYDKTVYILPVPTDQPGNIDLGLKIIYEWANNLNLSPEEIKNEKKVVYQEIKEFTSPDDFSEFKLEGSHYSNKVAIGTVSQVKSITPGALKNFYDCWYRPDLITIIAVGDLDPQQIEQKIKTQFKNYQPRRQSLLRPHPSLPVEGEVTLKAIEDTLLFSNKIELIFPVKDHPLQTFGDLRLQMIEDLFTRLLNNRLASDSTLNCNYTHSWYLSNIAHSVFSFSGNSDKELLSYINKAGQHLAEIKQYGLTPRELEWIKTDYIKRLKEKNDSYSSSFWCDNFIDLAITGDRFVENEMKKEFFKNQITEITNRELQDEASLFFNKARKMLITIRYNPDKSKTYKKKAVLRAWEKGLRSKTEPYIFKEKKKEEETTGTIKELNTGKLAQGNIAKETLYKNLGVSEILLSNGLRVSLKPTQATGNEIEISLFSRGGLSTVPDSTYHYFESTAAYIDMGGVGEYSASQLSDIMYDLDITISTLIADYYHMLYGSTSSGDLENLLKLFYLKITQPRKNYKDFEEVIANEVDAFGRPDILLERLKNSPGRALRKKIAEYSGTLPANKKKFESAEEIKAISLDALFQFYHSLFDKTKDMTMVICGKFDVEKAKELVVKYMGALPSNPSRNAIHFLGGQFPGGVHRDTITDPNNQRPFITYLVHGPYQPSLKESLILKIMRDVIQNRLVKKLREEKGLVYSPFVTVNYTSYPKAAYCFQIEYSYDRKNIGILEQALFYELEDLAKRPVRKEELKKIKQSFIVAKRDALSPDNYPEWRKKLQEIYLEEGSIQELDTYESILQSINIDEIQESFRQYINKKRFTVIQ